VPVHPSRNGPVHQIDRLHLFSLFVVLTEEAHPRVPHLSARPFPDSTVPCRVSRQCVHRLSALTRR
jgi:hypothetical protein